MSDLEKHPYLFNILFLVLLLLVPFWGWNPLFLAYAIRSYVFYKSNPNRKIRFFHIAITAILLLITAINFIHLFS